MSEPSTGLTGLAEVVLLTVTPSHVARLQHERPATGRRLHRLKTHIDRPLAAILSLNTFRIGLPTTPECLPVQG